MTKDGEQVRQRRERLGMDKKTLAAEAGVSRNTLAAIEGGEGFNRASLAKIERVLSELEHEAGLDAPAPAGEQREFKFEVIDADGFRIIAQGPVEDAEALKRQVLDIVRSIRRESGETE